MLSLSASGLTATTTSTQQRKILPLRLIYPTTTIAPTTLVAGT